MIATGAIAQSTAVTGHAAPVQIEREHRTKIRTHVAEHNVPPVGTREKIVVGQPVGRQVELGAVPAD
ncbi:DUF1236 domain-containing protein [Bradyrhizobium ivorense]|uniref:DUF1236 domain-containing protein n=1 Tax=Bradyrhizobium ivorense TaxID=2511166 RepID=UPI001E36C966|nr:DUF1236 domain-containing protein [Bradyrhizobium ivorense]